MGSVWSDGLSGDRSNCSIFARMARKSSVSGGELPARVHVTNHAAAIDEEADASMSARGRRAASASRSASRGPRPNSIVLDVAAHGLDIERLGSLVHADHYQAAAAVLLVETVQGRRGGAAERAARKRGKERERGQIYFLHFAGRPWPRLSTRTPSLRSISSTNRSLPVSCPRCKASRMSISSDGRTPRDTNAA